MLRFPGRQHQVWLEPEGLTSDLVYPQGLSMTMPPDVQLRLLREIPPLRRAEIQTPGTSSGFTFVVVVKHTVTHISEHTLRGAAVSECA